MTVAWTWNTVQNKDSLECLLILWKNWCNNKTVHYISRIEKEHHFNNVYEWLIIAVYVNVDANGGKM